MKVDIQTILNVCFAICITAFIYQNNAQQDRIDTLESYAQVDTDKTWDRLDSMDLEIAGLNEAMEDAVERMDKNLMFAINLQENVVLNEENIKILFKNDNETSKKNFDLLFEAVKINEERIIANRKAVRDLAEIMIR